MTNRVIGSSGWLAAAGLDPVQLLQAHAGRFQTQHRPRNETNGDRVRSDPLAARPPRSAESRSPGVLRRTGTALCTAQTGLCAQKLSIPQSTGRLNRRAAPRAAGPGPSGLELLEKLPDLERLFSRLTSRSLSTAKLMAAKTPRGSLKLPLLARLPARRLRDVLYRLRSDSQRLLNRGIRRLHRTIVERHDATQ